MPPRSSVPQPGPRTVPGTFKEPCEAEKGMGPKRPTLSVSLSH